MNGCDVCWAIALEIAHRTGQHPGRIYQAVVRQPRSHPHGLPQLDGIDAHDQQEATGG